MYGFFYFYGAYIADGRGNHLLKFNPRILCETTNSTFIREKNTKLTQIWLIMGSNMGESISSLRETAEVCI